MKELSKIEIHWKRLMYFDCDVLRSFDVSHFDEININDSCSCDNTFNCQH